MAHLRGRAGVGAGVVAAVLLLVSWLGTPPASASTPWGACGLGTDEDKLVTQYAVNAHTNVYLRCSGPRWDPNPTSGYRHILAKHRGDFERLASGPTRIGATSPTLPWRRSPEIRTWRYP
jgi:hypothetical protein